MIRPSDLPVADPYDNERIARRPPLGPKKFSGRRVDGGIELTVIDRGRLYSELAPSGTEWYHIYWSADVDTDSQDGLDAGFKRAALVESKSAPRKEDHAIKFFITRQEYQRGYFFCTGANPEAESVPTAPVNFDDSNTDGRTPPDVTHWQVTESGEDMPGGEVMSRLDFSAVAPDDVSNFAGVQLVYKDYPNLNEYSYGEFIRHRGGAKGTIQGFTRVPVGRRKGIGDLSILIDVFFGADTEFLAQANVGDYIEILNHRQEIESIADNTTLVSTAPWTGPDYAVTEGEWGFIALVRVFAVSIGYDGSQREDIENAPYVDVLLDGLLSAPLAPATLTLAAVGDAIYGEFTQVTGVDIDHYNVYRATGSGADFDDASLISTVKHEAGKSDSSSVSFRDTDFTLTQKETGQVFTYFVTSVNARGQESASQASDEQACQLNPNQGQDPTIPARNGAKNLLYNAGLSGTDTGDVVDTDAAQDTFNGIGGAPTGWTRWDNTIAGGAPTEPTFQNGDEIKLPDPDGGAASVHQDIDAWDHATNHKIPKGAMLTLQTLVRHGGVAPDGTFTMYVEQFDASGTVNAPRRYRDSADDALKYFTGNDARLEIPGSDLLSTWQIVYAVLKLDDAEPTENIRVYFMNDSSTSGDFYIKHPMLSLGEELTQWTGEMVDVNIQYGEPSNPPGDIGDSDGRRGPDIPIAVTP